MKRSVSYRNGQRLLLEGGGALRLSVNPRARRLSIRIDARAGEAVAVAPSERRLGEVVAFARTKAGWIAERLAARVETLAFEPGAVVTWLGRPVRLEATTVAPDEGLLAFGPAPMPGARSTLNLSPTGDLGEAAANLFAQLRALDRPEIACIAVMPIPQTGLGLAINDRLRRAAADDGSGRRG